MAFRGVHDRNFKTSLFSYFYSTSNYSPKYIKCLNSKKGEMKNVKEKKGNILDASDFRDSNRTITNISEY